MKIAVFSDIHGNFDALKYVTELIDKEHPDNTFLSGISFSAEIRKSSVWSI